MRFLAPILLLLATGPAVALVPCAPSAPPPGPTVRVTTTAELLQAVRNLSSGETILIADGNYDLTNTLHLFGGLSNVAIRGESGDRDAVVLTGLGMANPNFGNVPHGILLSDVSDVLIADLTIRDVWYHCIQVAGNAGATRVTLRNLHLIDAGEQFIKGSTAGHPGPYADDCLVECCLIEYTDRARSWYTNGVDVLGGARWIVRDNLFRRIRAPAGELAGPTVLFWRNSLDTVVERNLFLDCDRGIALGLSPPDANARDQESVYDHQGGLVRNNVFHRAAGGPTGDVGISINYCRDFRVIHNTVVLDGSFPWAIETRFDVTEGLVANNLSDGPILERNGARPTLQANVETALSSWFVDSAAGDLHLRASAAAAIDQAAPLADATDDYDGDSRPSGGAPDVGADELVSCTLPGVAVAGLRVSREGPDLLLSWQAATGAPSYNLWYVTDRSDGDRTRLADAPPAIGVAGCAEPSPAMGPSCRDADAVGRGSALHYYRVRSTCGGANEGP